MLPPQKCCFICEKPGAKYSCPKCSISYCSLGCYRDKRHTGCTESFYKDQIKEELQAQKGDEETKKEMHRIVQRYKDQIDNDNLAIGNPNAYSSDDDKSDEGRDEASILERLEGIDLNNNDNDIPASAIWDRLTVDEQKDFIRLVESEQIINLITAWHPWWDPPTEPKIVEIVDSGADKESNRTLDGVPKLTTVDKPVSKLAKKVHPSVLFQIVQICLAYVYMMRHLNGDPHGKNVTAAFEDLSLASPVLTSKTADIYESAHEALVVSFISIDQNMYCKPKVSLLEDLLKLYGNPTYVAAALSDTYSIIKNALALGELKGTRKAKSAAKYAEKRVYFLLSVVQQMIKDKDSWNFMAADISLLRRRFESESEILENTRYERKGGKGDIVISK